MLYSNTRNHGTFLDIQHIIKLLIYSVKLYLCCIHMVFCCAITSPFMNVLTIYHFAKFSLFHLFTSQVRDELEHLLDDDNDMAEMYLTEKLAEQTPLKEELYDEAQADDDEG